MIQHEIQDLRGEFRDEFKKMRALIDRRVLNSTVSSDARTG